MKLVNRLILALSTVVVAVGAASGFALYKTQEIKLLDLVSMGADQLSRGITSATWHAMLADRRDDVYQVMATIAAKQGIDRIRMFNSLGEETFSTVSPGHGARAGVKSAECRSCHEAGRKLETLRLQDRVRVHTAGAGSRSLSIVTPIPNEKSCSEAACHAHPKSEQILGVLEVEIKLDAVDAELASMQQMVIGRAAVELLIICALIIIFARRFVLRPIHQLIASTHEISNMNLEAPIEVKRGSAEIADLARSFDVMRIRLRQAVSEINEFTQKLETKVEERTQELHLAHQKLLQSDRMASLGQLSASVAHEINNPVAGILNLSMLLQRILKEDGIPPGRLADFRRYLGQITSETSRVGRIVSDLLAFSRRPAPHRSEADLNGVIQNTLSLISHKLKLNNVEVRYELDPHLPHLQCDRSQIQQAVLNLALNASEAMQGRPASRLAISTGRGKGATVWFRVADNGEGMSPQVLMKIFDPFFTTKPEGKGVGLGLAVTYGIVHAHSGEIEVQSAPGQGTAFTVTLPLQSSPPVPAPVEAPAA
jgi:two-component system NtrC family sensor kinase